MSKKILQFKCLLMSPSDVLHERGAATEVIQKWNAQIGEVLDANIDLVKWETHSQPEIGEHPQKILNKQLVEKADFGIGIFWSKLGTPTDTHPSGTIEEIEGLKNKGAKVFLYLSQQSIPQDMNKEYDRLSSYIKSIQNTALMQHYVSISDFRELFLLHLTRTVVDLIFKEKGFDINANINSILSPNSKGLEKPKIVIKTSQALVPTASGTIKCYLLINVQNHSPSTVFLGSLGIKLTNGNQVVFPRDAITFQMNARRELKSAESFAFYIDPVALSEKVKDLSLLDIIIIHDDIDRVYESDEEHLTKIVENLISL